MRVLVILFAWTMCSPSLAEPLAAPSTFDPRIEAAIETYRQDGAEQALPKFEALAKVFAAPSQVRDRTAVAHYIGECHWRLGRFDIAKQQLNRALQMGRASSDRLAEGKTLNTLGLLEWDQGNYEAAMARFRSAGAIARAIGDRKLEGSTLNNLSLVYDELGDYDTALKQYHRVLELYEGADFPRGLGDTLGNIGGVHLLLGQFNEALRYYQQALRVSQQIESKPAMSQDHGNIAMCLLGLGRVDEALANLDRSIALAQQAGMQQDVAYWTREKGNAFVQKGIYDRALVSYRAALAVYEKLGAQAELLETLRDHGRLHLLLGDYGSAERDFKRALELAQAIGLARGLTQSFLALGDLKARRKQWDDAASYYEQARKRSAESGEQNLHARALLSLAEVGRRQQPPRLAEDAAKEGLVIARKIGSLGLEARAHLVRGQLALDEGRPTESLTALDRSRQAIASVGDPELLWQIDYSRAKAFVAQGNIAQAVSALQAAVKVIESTRGRLLEPRFRAGYVEDKSEVYRELMRLQLKQGNPSDAFATAERMRAREYVERLGGRSSNSLSEDDRQQEAVLRARIRQLQGALSSESDDGSPAHSSRALTRFSAELAKAERDYQAFLDDRASTELSDGPLATDSLAGAVRAKLPANTALVEYVVGPTATVVFVLTSGGVVAHSLDLEKRALEARIELLRDLVRQPNHQQWMKPATKLYEQLISPLEAEGSLRDVRYLYLVPHGALNELSFAMLPRAAQGPSLLVDRYSVAYLPAASVLLHLPARASTSRSLLALAPASSRLRYAADEARSVDAIYRPNSRLLLGAQATESSFRQQAGSYQVLHLATHGHFDRLNPLLSGLQLESDVTNDGLLQVHEVLGLSLRSKLVTLSACDMALGSGYFADAPSGEDFIGMSRAFLTAGSSAVLAALWQVDDRASVSVMKRFYSELDKSRPGTSPAVALSEAQRQLRRSSDLQHPFYWAAYVVVGRLSPSSADGALSAWRTPPTGGTQEWAESKVRFAYMTKMSWPKNRIFGPYTVSGASHPPIDENRNTNSEPHRIRDVDEA